MTSEGDQRRSTPQTCRGAPGPAATKGRCEMTPDPTPPYRVPDFCPDCREKFLAVVGWIAPALESTLSPDPPEPITTPEDTLRARASAASARRCINGACRACWRGGNDGDSGRL